MRIPYTLILISLVLILFGCQQESQSPKIEKQHNRTGNPITITVIEHDSYSDATTALNKFHRENKLPRISDTSLGWSAWDLNPPYQCEIHVKPPTRIDDDDVLTLGHEMAHCLYGSYHK